MHAGPYRALLVDHGGVLTTSLGVSFGAFCLATGVSPERLKDLLAHAYGATGSARVGLEGEEGVDAVEGVPSGLGSLVPAIETGHISIEEFDAHLAEALSEGLATPLDPAGLAARLFAASAPDERMIGAVRAARRHGIATALVSNTWGLRASPAWYAEAFDAVVLSGQEGVRKPDPDIFLLAAGRLGVAPSECAFVDDIPANVEGARAVGMAGVLHRHADITIPRLEDLLGISLT